MAGTPIIWARGTLFRSIYECYTQPPTARTAVRTTGTWFASELEWLKKDLEENHSACTAAYWHQPLFSAANSISEEGTTSQAFWQLLYEHNADLVLNGHDHLYARYRPLDPSGNSDPKKGIRAAQDFLAGFAAHLGESCIGTISEIFDAEAPYCARGCAAQAWSVAEVLRCWVRAST